MPDKRGGGGASRGWGSHLGVAALGLGAASSALLRAYGDDGLTLAASGLLLALCVNALVVYRRSVDYYLTAASLSLLLLLYPLAGLVGAAGRYLDLVDLALVAVLLASIGHYWSLADMPSLFKTHTPVAVLASTLVGIHLGLRHPARLAVLTVADALTSLVVASGGRSRAESAAVLALLFVLFYVSPIVSEADVRALAAFAALYSARSLALLSGGLGRYRRRVGDLVSLEVVLKPLLVALA